MAVLPSTSQDLPEDILSKLEPFCTDIATVDFWVPSSGERKKASFSLKQYLKRLQYFGVYESDEIQWVDDIEAAKAAHQASLKSAALDESRELAFQSIQSTAELHGRLEALNAIRGHVRTLLLQREAFFFSAYDCANAADDLSLAAAWMVVSDVQLEPSPFAPLVQIWQQGFWPIGPLAGKFVIYTPSEVIQSERRNQANAAADSISESLSEQDVDPASQSAEESSLPSAPSEQPVPSGDGWAIQLDWDSSPSSPLLPSSSSSKPGIQIGPDTTRNSQTMEMYAASSPRVTVRTAGLPGELPPPSEPAQELDAQENASSPQSMQQPAQPVQQPVQQVQQPIQQPVQPIQQPIQQQPVQSVQQVQQPVQQQYSSQPPMQSVQPQGYAATSNNPQQMAAPSGQYGQPVQQQTPTGYAPIQQQQVQQPVQQPVQPIQQPIPQQSVQQMALPVQQPSHSQVQAAMQPSFDPLASDAAAPVIAPKKSRTGLWVVLSILLVGGAGGGWFFYTQSAGYLFGEAKAAYNNKKFVQSELTLQSVVQKDVKFPGAQRLLGIVSLVLNKSDDAERAFKLAVLQQPKDAISEMYLGHLLLKKGDYALAFKALSRATSLAPKEAYAWLNLGQVLYAQKLYAKARISLRKATELQPNLHSAWFELGSSFLRDAQRLALQAPPPNRKGVRKPPTPELLSLAKKAETALRQALLHHKSSSLYHQYLGNALLLQQQYDSAQQAYQNGLSADSRAHAGLWHDMGVLLMQQYKYKDALSFLLRAVAALEAAHQKKSTPSTKRKLAIAYYNLGIAFESDKSKIKQAIAAYRKHVALSPTTADGFCRLGQALRSARERNMAGVAYLRCYQLNPPDKKKVKRILRRLGKRLP